MELCWLRAMCCQKWTKMQILSLPGHTLCTTHLRLAQYKVNKLEVFVFMGTFPEALSITLTYAI